MLDKLIAIEAKYSQIEARLAAPETYDDPAQVARLNKEQAELAPLVETVRTYQQALEARREALALAEDEGALALCANACLVARGVRKGRRPFPSGKAVLAAYGPEEIETLARRWAAWNQREGLGPDLAPGRLEGLSQIML